MGVSPTTELPAGGSAVTITASGFTNVLAVLVGDAVATGVDIVSPTKLTASAPSGSGTVPITILPADGGQSSPGTAIFTYGRGGRPPAGSHGTTLTVTSLQRPEPDPSRDPSP